MGFSHHGFALADGAYGTRFAGKMEEETGTASCFFPSRQQG